MNKKKKTAKICPNLSGDQKNINNKFSVYHSISYISTKPENEKRGQRCYNCLSYAYRLAGFVIWERLNLSSVKYGLCQSCWKTFLTLPPSMQQCFAQKCERNIEKTLGVKNG